MLKRIALIGNPNCGKTTLLNALTGSTLRVGNFCGVTVSAQTRSLHTKNDEYQFIDLPGLYTLNSSEMDEGTDEDIARSYIIKNPPEIVINIIDARFIERGLYVSLQLLARGIPLIIAVSMLDICQKNHDTVDLARLSTHLGVPVVPATPAAIMQALEKPLKSSYISLPYPSAILTGVATIIKELQTCADDRSNMLQMSQAIRLLENDVWAHAQLPTQMHATVQKVKQDILQTTKTQSDILIASARYQYIENIVGSVYTRAQVKKSDNGLDSVVLHRFLGLPVFLMCMYAMFWFAINGGGLFQGVIEHVAEVLFVQWPVHLITPYSPFMAHVVSSMGMGLVTTLAFAPVLGAMFFALSVLEESGYMARAAFVVDRLMQFLGLPGKSFVPLIIGFGCNVPAIMGTRILESHSDRIVTILMSPFMSCGARLAIFTVFVAAFFPIGGHNVVFALYLIGITMAIITGLVLKKIFIKEANSPLLMEMPPYQMPKIKMLCKSAGHRLKRFLQKAGKIIVPLCMVLGMLNTPVLKGEPVLESVGKAFTPIFAPMGITQDNWPATVGLITGLLAKEVVVGTLNALYVPEMSSSDNFDLRTALAQTTEVWADDVDSFKKAFTSPFAAQLKSASVSADTQKALLAHFDGATGAFAYLLFVLLYFPCVSVVAAMGREIKTRWTIFSVVWTTLLAYGTAVLFYQYAYFMQNPTRALTYTVIFGCAIAVVFKCMPKYKPRFPTRIIITS